MKLKRQPEDFQVEELTNVGEATRGRHRLYRLTKRGIGTMEAIELICRRWNLAGRQVSYGGLKDRHAVTVQHLTILDGPKRVLRESNFELEPVGQLSHPYGSQHFSGNRFLIVLRDLSDTQAAAALTALRAVPETGLANYFDDQRFGSVGYSGQFIAHAWLKSDHEQALKLALAEMNPFDRSAVKSQKVVVREYWGQWSEAKARLERSSTRSIVTYLVDHPTDFRGAFARLNRELRSLQFSAFQSHLWNLMLSGWICRHTRSDQRVMVDLKLGSLAFPLAFDPEQKEAIEQVLLPLPSARTPRPDGALGDLIGEVLLPFGVEWNDLRIRHLKDVFFSKGTRCGLVVPRNLQTAVLEDDLHPGRKAVRMGFDLPRGSYATILVKRITQATGPAR
jgi:tRNA pseudouridine13 synthase